MLFEPDLSHASVGKLLPLSPVSYLLQNGIATKLLFSDLWADVLAVRERSPLPGAPHHKSGGDEFERRHATGRRGISRNGPCP